MNAVGEGQDSTGSVLLITAVNRDDPRPLWVSLWGKYNISMRYVKNLVLDHVSASRSVDETMSIYHCENITVQYSMITQSMFNSNHVKESPGFGGI